MKQEAHCCNTVIMTFRRNEQLPHAKDIQCIKVCNRSMGLQSKISMVLNTTMSNYERKVQLQYSERLVYMKSAVTVR